MKTAHAAPRRLAGDQFTGLSSLPFVSYARIIDAQGKTWPSAPPPTGRIAQRLTLLDSALPAVPRRQVGEVPFFDVDHSPVGSWSTFIYGMEASGGVQVCKQPGGDGTLVPHQGVIIAVKNGTAERLMPFASTAESRCRTCAGTATRKSRARSAPARIAGRFPWA